MIDFAEDLRQTLVSLARENKALSDNLTAVQTRCTELLEEKRLLYKMCETLRHERNLAAESVANGFWLWSDTDDNWLDGLANDALITMSAAQLRELIAERRARELEDQRATGDVLAGILGRERCVDGNVCLAICHHSHTAYQYSDALSMIRAGYAIAASRGVGPWAKKALEDSGGSA